jgi:hypothetical protein
MPETLYVCVTRRKRLAYNKIFLVVLNKLERLGLACSNRLIIRCLVVLNKLERLGLACSNQLIIRCLVALNKLECLGLV